MTKRVQTTKIEKKTKSGEKFTIDYAKVVDRLNEFRKDNPRGSITTKPTINKDYLMFEVYVVKDKADKNSADATGHAMAKPDSSEKQFEKLETIATGRALALLGYGASGEVASFEEMEDFTTYRDNKIEEMIQKMESLKTIDALRKYFMSLGSYMAESRIIEAKDKCKEALNANS